MNENNPTAYQPFLKEIQDRQIQCYEMLKTVSKNLTLYWEIGKSVKNACRKNGANQLWEQLSKDLQTEHPD